MWEHMDSNQGPSACKADALNQLSYAPLIEAAKILFFLIPQNNIDIFEEIFYISIGHSKPPRVRESEHQGVCLLPGIVPST